MIKWLLLAAVPLVHGCATMARPRPTADWIVGVWLEQPTGERDLLACNSGVPVVYRRDGTFGSWEWDGVWRLDRDRLIVTATVDNEMVPPEQVPIGKPSVSRVERLGDNEMAETHSNGQRVTLLRCPQAR